MARRGYPAEFRQWVLELVASAARWSTSRGISASPNRRSTRLTGAVRSGSTEVKRRSDDRRTRRVGGRQAQDRGARDRAQDPPSLDGAPEGLDRPKRRWAAIAVMADEQVPVQLACRVLGVSESGYHARRPDRLRSVRSGTPG